MFPLNEYYHFLWFFTIFLYERFVILCSFHLFLHISQFLNWFFVHFHNGFILLYASFEIFSPETNIKYFQIKKKQRRHSRDAFCFFKIRLFNFGGNHRYTIDVFVRPYCFKTSKSTVRTFFSHSYVKSWISLVYLRLIGTLTPFCSSSFLLLYFITYL